MKKVAFLVAPGFEETEFAAPYDILQRFGCDVITVGVQGLEVTGQQGLTVKTDTTLDRLDSSFIDALVLPGGKGSWVMRDTPAVITLVQQTYAAGKLICAICAAPIVLAKAGIIDGIPVSAYPADAVFEDLPREQVSGKPVTISGNIVTAYGPAAALAFGYAIAEQLAANPAEVQPIKEAMLYVEH